jgi:GNAT superfamily N-acetyltransferase
MIDDSKIFGIRRSCVRDFVWHDGDMSTVRMATTADADAIAEVQVLGWRRAYEEILPGDFLAALSVERRTEWWSRQVELGTLEVLVVDDDDGQVAGFASMGPANSSEEAELYAIYLLPERWGQGLGRALILAAEDLMAEQGYQICVLWVFADNTRARQFYETAGWELDGALRVEEFGGVQPTQVRYRRHLG